MKPPNTTPELDQAVVELLIKAGLDSDSMGEPKGLSPPIVFQQHFGGLTVECTLGTGKKDLCKFFKKPDNADWKCSDAMLSQFDEAVVPVGELLQSGMRLLLTNSGGLYCFLPEIPEVIWQYGFSIEEGLNNLILGGGAVRI